VKNRAHCTGGSGRVGGVDRGVNTVRAAISRKKLARDSTSDNGPRKRNKIGRAVQCPSDRDDGEPSDRVLSLSAHRVLDRISIELAHPRRQRHGKLPVTYDQFEEYGIHRKAIPPGHPRA